MRTLNLEEAAAFLKLHPEELRHRAKRGVLPGAKVGRRWVFVDEDLVAFLRSLYASAHPALRVQSERDSACHLVSGGRSGGLTSSLQAESEYAELLKPRTRPSLKSCATS